MTKDSVGTFPNSSLSAQFSQASLPNSILAASFSERVLAAANDGFFEWHSRDNHFQYSDSFASLLGYAPGQLPLDPSQISAHIFSEDFPSLKMLMAQASYRGENLDTQFRMYTQAGELCWFKLQLSVIEKDMRGHGTCFIGTLRNIDAEVKAHLALLERAKAEQWIAKAIRGLLRRDDPAIYDTTLSELCDFIDIDYAILRRTTHHGDIFTLTHLGHNSSISAPIKFFDAIPKTQLPYNLTKLRNGEIDYITAKDLNPHSKNRALQQMYYANIQAVATLPIIFQGQVDHYLSLIKCGEPKDWPEDHIKLAQGVGAAMALVTSRRRMTQELEINALRLLNVLDATQDAIWDWDVATDNYFVSHTFLFMLGYDEELLPLTRVKLAELLITPNSIQTLLQNSPTDATQPANVFSLQATFRHRDGHPVTTFIRGKQIAWDDDGNPTHCVGAVSYMPFSYMQWCDALFSDTPFNSTHNLAPFTPLDDATTLQGLKALLVEDNLVNQQVAKGILRRRGIEVTVANNGQEAIDILHSATPHSFDVILMDLDMPVLDGCHATEAIRKMPGFTQTPIIAVTAHTRQQDRARCITAGMDDHIPKPIRPEQLYAAIKKYCRASPQLTQ